MDLLKNFNPLPLCRGRLYILVINDERTNFNPLPLCRGRQQALRDIRQASDISIHSPYAGGDRYHFEYRLKHNNFNPLPLCRGRQGHQILSDVPRLFQSTPPMQGETLVSEKHYHYVDISIHSPYAGGDLKNIKF